MKKILVTGASGFVGRHLCEWLTRQGYEVKGAFCSHPPKKKKTPCQMVFLDLTEPLSVNQLIQTWKPDGVVHLAAQSIPRLSWQKEVQTITVNTGGTIHLLNALRLFSPTARFLYVSTNQVYGASFRQGLAVKESTPLRPENPYAYSKALAEMACQNFYASFGLPVMIARPFNHAGMGQLADLAFSNWCRQIARMEQGLQRRVLSVGNLNVRRDFLHVQDVVRAYTLILRKGKIGEIYNIASEISRPLREYVGSLQRLAKRSFRVRGKKGRFQGQEIREVKGNARKLKALGWRVRSSPFLALEELLNEWRDSIQTNKGSR